MGPKKTPPEKEQSETVEEVAIDFQRKLSYLEDKLKQKENEVSFLTSTLRTQEQTAISEGDSLIRTYQHRINDIWNNGNLGSATRSDRVDQQYRDQTGNFNVPMSRQLLFDGNASWESFIQPFK